MGPGLIAVVAVATLLGSGSPSPATSGVAGFWTLDCIVVDAPAADASDEGLAPGPPCEADPARWEGVHESPVTAGRLMLPRRLTIAPAHHAVIIIGDEGVARRFPTSARANATPVDDLGTDIATEWDGEVLRQQGVLRAGQTVTVTYVSSGDHLVVTQTVRTPSSLSLVTYRYRSDALR